MSIVTFTLTVLCLPFLPSGANVPRWALLSLVASAILWKVRIDIRAVVIFLFLCLTALWAPVGYDALFYLWHFLLLAVLFLYANQHELDFRKIAIAVCLGMTINSALVGIEYFAIDSDYFHYKFTTITGQGGLYFNRNISAEVAGMAFVIGAAYRLWYLLPGLMPTIVFGSRSCVFAIGVTGMVALWGRSKLATLAVAVAAVATVAVMWYLRAYSSVDSSMLRGYVWLDTAEAMNFFGHGLASFIADSPAFLHHIDALHLRFDHAHNDFIQVAYELGIGGVLLVGLLLAKMATAPRSPAWYCLLAFLVLGCSGFPLYMPVTGALAALCAGRVCADGARLRDMLDAVRRRIRDWLAAAQPEAFSGGGYSVPAFAGTQIGVGLFYYPGRGLFGRGPGDHQASPEI